MSGRVVVVTGASAGVGRAVARAFARAGDDVALLARGREGLAGARRDLGRLGVRTWSDEVDVSDAAAVDDAAARIEDELGPIDVWVNNAMAGVIAPVVDTSADDIRRVTEVTYLGTVNGTKAALRCMQPRDSGVVVQVGSALAFRAIPLQAAYSAAKHAVRGFTDALRVELRHAESGIHVAMVHLPGLNTPQFDWVRTCLARQPRPVAPVYEPELAADAVVWIADHPRRQVFVGDMTALSVLSAHLAPGLVDAYLARTGVDSQQGDEHVAPRRPDNLWAPVPGDHGARGRFSEEAHRHSPSFWLTRHRWVAAGAAGVVLGSLAWRRASS